MLLTGIPTFATLERYVPRNSSIGETAAFFGNMIEGHVPLQQLKKIRDSWDGILLVKGILHPEDAKQCLSVGVDGLIVSNHGGRQIDAAPASVEVVGRIRKSVGPEIVIIADGGVRSGLDVARMIASGANFVLLGRPFVFAVAALGAKGGEHVMHILNEEFRTTMAQLGCSRTELLPDFLSP
jgi:L-lactate dehydrogenase (cytochrome)